MDDQTVVQMIGRNAGGRWKDMEKDRKNLVDGYIGTYHSEKSRGIYHFSFHPDTGRMTEPELFYEARNAKWVSLNDRMMIFPVEKDGRAGTCFLELGDEGVRHAAEILEERQTPCYILQEGDMVYTANYHEGTVMVYRLQDGEPSLVKRIENGTGAGCHQILLHETMLMVPCLTQDRIRLFDISREFAPAGEILFPGGSGPRHGVFNREHTTLYVVSELSNELFVFHVKGSEFRLVQSLSVLPEGEVKGAASAAIRLTADENYIYISVRGLNQLAVLHVGSHPVSVIQHVSSGGDHPRDFVLSGDERFLLAANRLEGGIVCMERDEATGLLGAVRQHVAMPEAVSLVLHRVV